MAISIKDLQYANNIAGILTCVQCLRLIATQEPVWPVYSGIKCVGNRLRVVHVGLH